MKCGQKSCKKEATKKFYWPGQDPLPSCNGCADKALWAAKVLGFYIAVELIQKEKTQ